MRKMFLLCRFVSLISVFCLICILAAATQAQTRGGGRPAVGKFVSGGTHQVMRANVAHLLEKRGGGPPDCPGGPPCPVVLQAKMSTLQNWFGSSKNSRLAILYAPSNKVVLDQLTLYVIGSKRIKYQSGSNCQGCGLALEPPAAAAAANGSITGFLFNLNPSLQTAFDKYKGISQNFLTVTVKTNVGVIINEENFYFVKIKTRSIKTSLLKKSQMNFLRGRATKYQSEKDSSNFRSKATGN